MAETEEKIALLRQWLMESEHAVFFGGAGVSTESGLADFRSAATGLYNNRNLPYSAPAEQILTEDFMLNNTEEFFEFYKKELLNPAAPPNYTHYALADMEKKGIIKAVITQNADNLHQRAGSKHVIDLHGNVYNNTCLRCGKKHTVDTVLEQEGIPYCECGGVIRPGIVLFGEVPDMSYVMQTVRELNKCDLVLICGTSMRVSSAIRLFNNFKDARIVVLNAEDTAIDDRADLIIRGGLGDIFRMLWPME